MPEETKMAVEAEQSPAKKQVIGKAAHCKVTMLDGSVIDVYVDVSSEFRVKKNIKINILICFIEKSERTRCTR